MIPHDTHLQIGCLLFEGLDQIDLTVPFEMLSRIPNSTCRICGKTLETVRDLNGLRLTPDAVLADAPPLRVSAAGVTAGIEGALRLAAALRGDAAAQAIRLEMAYAPEPPFDSGTPATAPVAMLEQARRSVRDITAQCRQTASWVARRLGIAVPAVE